MTGRPRRVPPPPPPGFGDDEYYRLYGKPEEYQKYRKELERARIRAEEVSPPQHEEYYVYRRFASHEESYDYYYGPHSQRIRPGASGKRRIAPPPPPGFESPVTRRRPASSSGRGRPSRRYSSEDSDEDEKRRSKFENFKVTIKAKEGDETPSLSEDSDQQSKKSKMSKKKRKKKEKERRRILEKKLAEKEKELKLLAAQNTEELAPVKKKSIKDRLGIPPGGLNIKKEKDLNPVVGGKRKQFSPIPSQIGNLPAKKRGRSNSPVKSMRRSLSPGKPRGRSSSPARKSTKRSSRPLSSLKMRERSNSLPKQRDHSEPSLKRRKRSPSPPGKQRSSLRDSSRRKRSESSRKRSESPSKRREESERKRKSTRDPSKTKAEEMSRADRRRRNQERSPIVLNNRRRRLNRRSLSRGRRRTISRTRSRGPPNPNRRRKRGRRRNRRRDRWRDRRLGGDMSKAELEDLKEENKKMQARLRRKKSGGKDDGMIIDRLNRLAGIDGIKPHRKSRSGSADTDSDDSDSGSGSDSDRDEKRRRRRKPVGKMRSDRMDLKKETSEDRSKEKWQHDKFQAVERGGRKDETETFGSHWSKIKSEKEKEEERRRSRSRSRKKKRRRGKFSRSRSRSSDSSSSRSSRSSSRSSSSSRSRSGSYSSRSGSSSDSRSRSRSPKRPVVERAAERALKEVGGGGEEEKEGVNLGLSGALTAEVNSFNGTVVKYSEPPEARKPKRKWRLYVFKGNEELPILYIHRHSAYLCGRDRKVADIPLDHPSCSKQHAALQYRLVSYTREDGTTGRRVQPYVLDLGSANGTYVNNSRIEAQKYVQLLEKDVLKFGFSSREYVLLHDQSKEDEEDLGLD
ncbi:serine/arginine repetitive matrix protein 2-like [Eurytemora carolleeae]|uniref:serine/arginine repetitive matrix protein 2-like n=1 Tax=Eurytemora carolleeae TaxID=1294199 RepID=UPI000C75D7D6|nr:serine/arginine repetitive matrix protein 2-like [Eurytemora carolleeae]|eukprot:XP_023330836.1 serine/arginine repetitive matrix protein 2-like [Eurytemora affinis]